MKNVDEVSFGKILAWVDRDTLPETPPNYPPMASWPGFGDTGRIKAAWRRSLRLDGGRRPVVYVHVPFCETLCKFCGFYKLPAAPGAIDRYLDALEKEALMLGPLFKGRPLRSLCIGGGTPSLLSLAQLRRLFSLLRAHFKITAGTKIAFESSPNTLDVSKLAFLKSAGVEWLAIGVQSFDARLLNALNRRQDPVQVMEVIKQAKKAGIGQVEVDLMAGLPGQTRDSFLKDVEKVAALDLERIFLFEFQPKCGTAVAEKGGSLSAPFLIARRLRRSASLKGGLAPAASARSHYAPLFVRQKKEFRRPDGMRVKFEDNAAVVLKDEKGNPKGTLLKGPIPKEVCGRWPAIAKIASVVI